MGPLLPTELSWKEGNTVAHAVAIVVTVYRVYYRSRTHGLWWDDYFAAFALVVNIIALVFTWTGTLLDPLQHVPSRIALAWVLNLIYSSIIWGSRISLILSISRILTPREPLFKYTILVAFLFGLLMTLSNVQIVVACARDTSWYHTPPFQCSYPESLIIFFVTTDVTTDLLLFVIPLRIFWHVRLPAVEKRLILGGFAASLLPTIVSIICAILLMGDLISGAEKFVLSKELVQLLATVSLIVCNFLVIITRFYSFCQKASQYLARRELEKEPTTVTALSSEIILTEVFDLSSSDPESFSPDSERRSSPVTANLAPESTNILFSEVRVAQVRTV